MGADYTIECKCCGQDLSTFYITRNYNLMFPFWMLHNHIHAPYESDKRHPFIEDEEYKFLLRTVRNALKYYVKGNIYNHSVWESKMMETEEYQERRGWEVNKFTVVMALIRYYWQLKRYPFRNYRWRCCY